MSSRFAYPLLAASTLLCAGCASPDAPETPVFELEIWDCRGDKPRRIDERSHDAGDALVPHFAAPVVSEENSAADKKETK